MAQSNVSRQRVVDWCCSRERASSELGTDARDGQQRSADGAHWSGQCRDWDVSNHWLDHYQSVNQSLTF